MGLRFPLPLQQGSADAGLRTDNAMPSIQHTPEVIQAKLDHDLGMLVSAIFYMCADVFQVFIVFLQTICQ